MSSPDQARTAFSEYTRRTSSSAWLADPHLQSLVHAYKRDEDATALAEFGEQVAGPLDTWVRQSNCDENLPVLNRYDGQGNRTEQVTFHPTYHDLGRAVYATGVMSRYREPGGQIATLALTYLYAQNGEAGHACPLACTAGMIRILQSTGQHADWLERLYDPNYDTHFHASQFLTEVQGGSDVGANAVLATEEDGQWRLYGEKWFCSVIDAQLFLVTARAGDTVPGTRGVRAFVVPRTVDGQVNHFHIRRLKYKLGTRSMASAEVDFVGAVATPVSDFKSVVEVVLNTSRLYNAICSAGMLQRAWREAHAYAHTRMAFSQPIVAFPTVARIVARLKVMAYSARATTFLLADLSDQLTLGTASKSDARAFRIGVNLNKFWTSIQGTSGIRDAIEVLGGNGAIESFSVLPRLLRDSIVCEAWEGGHNVLCAQVLKDSARLGLHTDLFHFLRERGGANEALDRVEARWNALIAGPPERAVLHMRTLAEELRAPAQEAALRWEAAQSGSDPALPVVIEDLKITSERGYDALFDDTLSARLTELAK